VNNRGAHGAKAGEFGIMALIMLNIGMPALIAAQRAQAWRPGIWCRRCAGAASPWSGSATSAATRRNRRGISARSSPACVPAAGAPRISYHMVTVEALDTVLPQTEFLIMACPLTPATRNMMDRRRLGLLPGRGGN